MHECTALIHADQAAIAIDGMPRTHSSMSLRKTRRTLCATLVLCLAWPVVASADEARQLFNLTVGRFGLIDDSSRPWVVGVEYRMRPVGEWGLRPAIGMMAADNDALFAYVEIRRDFRAGRDWVVSPSFGVGLFNEKDGLLLGHPVEFRTGIEVAHEFDGGQRLGVTLFHVSNGGLSGRNPGTEVLSASFSIPLPD